MVALMSVMHFVVRSVFVYYLDNKNSTGVSKIAWKYLYLDTKGERIYHKESVKSIKFIAFLLNNQC